ncbi:MAG: hypothetical protein ACAI25_11670, partial [Planctomycetota bacterium]
MDKIVSHVLADGRTRPARLATTLSAIAGPEAGGVVRTVLEGLFAEGFEEGYEEAIDEGFKEGFKGAFEEGLEEVRLIFVQAGLRLLRRRFGKLTATITRRVE